jgi:dihydrofolate synthase/folylpolyglutamate synthase
VVVLAVLQDKDAAGIVAALRPIAARFVVPHARTERAVAPDVLVRTIREAAPEAEVEIADSFARALEQARRISERILITGSLHFAGEALATLDGNPDDLEDCVQ